MDLLVRLFLASSSAFLGVGFGALPPFGPKKDRISEGIFGDDYCFNLTKMSTSTFFMPSADVAWVGSGCVNPRQSRSSLEVRV